MTHDVWRSCVAVAPKQCSRFMETQPLHHVHRGVGSREPVTACPKAPAVSSHLLLSASSSLAASTTRSGVQRKKGFGTAAVNAVGVFRSRSVEAASRRSCSLHFKRRGTKTHRLPLAFKAASRLASVAFGVIELATPAKWSAPRPTGAAQFGARRGNGHTVAAGNALKGRCAERFTTRGGRVLRI